MTELKAKVKEYFTGLEFDELSHTYGFKDRALSSVSSLIKTYVEFTDFDKIAGFVAKKRSRLEGKRITKAMVLQEWEDKKNFSCNQGNRVHTFGENYDGSTSTPTDGFERSVVNFWDSVPDHIEPFLFELKMFSEKYGIAGTTDILLYNTKTGNFIIADYKTNEDLFKNFKGKKLLAPFEHLLDSPYNKYQIQLSLYQILFEQCGYKVEARKIVWLKPDGTYQAYNTIDYTDILLKELNNKK